MQNSELIERFARVKATIPERVKIVAVSKYKPVSMINALMEGTGHLIFGENKAQELFEKNTLIHFPVEWHFIGHLQTNKVKLIAPFVHLIQSIDSVKLLNEVEKEAVKCNRPIGCLLQVHIAQEEAKFGFSAAELLRFLDSYEFHELKNVRICGVMGMATYTDNETLIRNEFISLRQIFDKLKAQYFADSIDFKEVSMGMTGDYKIAIDQGSTMVRIGSAIFGDR